MASLTTRRRRRRGTVFGQNVALAFDAFIIVCCI